MNRDCFISILQDRGFIYQCTNIKSITQLSNKQKIVAYTGFDCTAASLHVGNLVQIMRMRWLQKCGHQPIILLGGATTKIGDPTGKTEARKILPTDEIQRNKNNFEHIFRKFLDFESSNKAIIVDNAEWLEEINYMDFLRKFGPYFSVNRLISFESIKNRLDREQSLSVLEFNYILLQAYDYFYLYDQHNCILQMGGSDQWGNIIAGVELIKKRLGKEVFGLTSPLITTSSGAKMGKTENGAIWLTNTMLSEYEYWQFWRNTEDSHVITFLKLFTELSLEEIAELAKLKGYELNHAKIVLANEATTLCHGVDAAQNAYQTSINTFENKLIGESLPRYKITMTEISQHQYRLVQLLTNTGLTNSNSNAKKLIANNGVKISNKTINNIEYIITLSDFHNNEMKLSIGKKKHILIQLH